MLRKLARAIAVGAVALGVLIFSHDATGQGQAGQPDPAPHYLPMYTAPDHEEYVPDEVVVKFADTLDAATRTTVILAVGAEWKETGWGGHFDVLRVTAGEVERIVALLNAQTGIEFAEPNYLYYAFATANDTYHFPYQWNMYNYGELSNGVPSNNGIQAHGAWDTTTGANTTVAVVDTGVAYETFGSFVLAPDLAGQTFVSPFNFINNTTHANDDNGHGTHVTGTIAQRTNNNMGCAGVAYNARIMPVKVLNSAGSGTLTAIANGINYATDHGANVINMSLGGSSGSSALQAAVDYAWNHGVVLCAATGNNGTGTISYPARYTNCIAVGATRFDGNRASYSQWGTGIDVVAPGGYTSLDQNGDGYGDGILQQTFSGSPSNFGYYFFQGTSMATPHVAAVAALVKSKHPSYTNAQVRSAIESTCKDKGTAGWDNKYGWGIVNAAAAVNF
jgi:serine protease